MRRASRISAVLDRPGVCACDKLVLRDIGVLALRKEKHHIHKLLLVWLGVVDLKPEALGKRYLLACRFLAVNITAALAVLKALFNEVSAV